MFSFIAQLGVGSADTQHVLLAADWPQWPGRVATMLLDSSAPKTVPRKGVEVQGVSLFKVGGASDAQYRTDKSRSSDALSLAASVRRNDILG